MWKILWKRGEIAPEEQFLLLPTIFCYLVLDFFVKTRIRFSLRDERLFEITEVEIKRVDCIARIQMKTSDSDGLKYISISKFENPLKLHAAKPLFFLLV